MVFKATVFPNGITASVVNDQSGAYNVKAYGAVMDGTTDDSAALQAAIDAADAAGGGVVFIPGGNLALGSKITTGAIRGVHITGAQMIGGNSTGGTTVSALSSLTTEMFDIGAAIDFSMANMLINADDNAANCLKGTNLQRPRFDRIMCQDSTEEAVLFTWCWDALFSNCRFWHTNTPTSGPTVLLQSDGVSTTNRIKFDFCTFEDEKRTSIKVDDSTHGGGGSNIAIVDCKFENSGVQCDWNSIELTNVNHVTVDRCQHSVTDHATLQGSFLHIDAVQNMQIVNTRSTPQGSNGTVNPTFLVVDDTEDDCLNITLVNAFSERKSTTTDPAIIYTGAQPNGEVQGFFLKSRVSGSGFETTGLVSTENASSRWGLT